MAQDCLHGSCLIVTEGASAVLCLRGLGASGGPVPDGPARSSVPACLVSGAALGPLLAGLISPSGWNNVFYMLMLADACALLVSRLAPSGSLSRASPRCRPDSGNPFSLGPRGCAGQAQLPYSSLSKTLFLSGLSQGQRRRKSSAAGGCRWQGRGHRTGAPALGPGPAAWRPGGLSVACGRTGWPGCHMHGLSLASSR